LVGAGSHYHEEGWTGRGFRFFDNFGQYLLNKLKQLILIGIVFSVTTHTLENFMFSQIMKTHPGKFYVFPNYENLDPHDVIWMTYQCIFLIHF